MKSKVIYEDRDIIVVNKPAGLSVEGEKAGTKDLESEIKNYLKDKGETPQIYVVHRLDKPVSGLVLLAKKKEIAAKLSEGIRAGDFVKEYEALVLKKEGFVSSGRLEDYLLKEKGNNISIVSEDGNTPGAKKAVLTFETLREDEKSALLKIKLLTGRHHQIRLQLLNAGMPILGDRKYATKESLELSEELGIRNTALKAAHLVFLHPVTKKQMDFSLEE